MATISIPWQTGGGNIVIEYTEGDNILSVYSDTENLGKSERSQVVYISTTKGTPQIVRELTIKQGERTTPYLKLADEGFLKLENGRYIKLNGGG